MVFWSVVAGAPVHASAVAVVLRSMANTTVFRLWVVPKHVLLVAVYAAVCTAVTRAVKKLVRQFVSVLAVGMNVSGVA